MSERGKTEAQRSNPVPLDPADIPGSDMPPKVGANTSPRPNEKDSDAATKSISPQGHRQRLREKFLKASASGAAESLPDYEILELLLFAAIPYRDVRTLAKTLLDRFGSLAAVFAASPHSLAKVPGIKDSATATLKVMHEAGVRMVREEIIDRPILSSWERVIDYCHAAMACCEVEDFRLLFLDRKNRLIGDERQQHGTVDQTPIYPREVVKRCLDLHASAVIMVHNHPSGDPQPSPSDIQTTQRIREALSHVDITLHDHLIVSRTGYCSFKLDGLL